MKSDFQRARGCVISLIRVIRANATVLGFRIIRFVRILGFFGLLGLLGL